jgi:hypothetical protein
MFRKIKELVFKVIKCRNNKKENNNKNNWENEYNRWNNDFNENKWNDDTNWNEEIQEEKEYKEYYQEFEEYIFKRDYQIEGIKETSEKWGRKVKDLLNEIMAKEEILKEEYKEVMIPLGRIRYSQRRINPLCQSKSKRIDGEIIRFGNRWTVYESIEMLKEGKVIYGKKKYNDKIIPYIEVVEYKGFIFSHDNRRLYILKNVYNSNEKIKCIIRKIDSRFKGKREQAKRERDIIDGKEKYHDWRSIIIDESCKGNYKMY